MPPAWPGDHATTYLAKTSWHTAGGYPVAPVPAWERISFSLDTGKSNLEGPTTMVLFLPSVGAGTVVYGEGDEDTRKKMSGFSSASGSSCATLVLL